jgi:hypothetical protein
LAHPISRNGPPCQPAARATCPMTSKVYSVLVDHAEHLADELIATLEVTNLMQLITGLNTIPPPPLSPTTKATTSSAMEEMSLQILDVQRDIQDMLDVLRNPTGKRKRAPSDTRNPIDALPTTPTMWRPTTRKPRDVSPVHSLMHSYHVTTAAQEVLDALMLGSSPSLIPQILSEATNPTPTTTPESNMPPTNMSTAAPESTKKGGL